MAFTRKMLKAMNIEDEKIDQIIDAHSETVDALKADRAKGNQPKKRGSYSGTMDGEKDEFVAIGSNVPYFQAIELGGQNRKAHHILKKSATEHTGQYKQLVKDAYENA